MQLGNTRLSLVSHKGAERLYVVCRVRRNRRRRASATWARPRTLRQVPILYGEACAQGAIMVQNLDGQQKVGVVHLCSILASHNHWILLLWLLQGGQAIIPADHCSTAQRLLLLEHVALVQQACIETVLHVSVQLQDLGQTGMEVEALCKC